MKNRSSDLILLKFIKFTKIILALALFFLLFGCASNGRERALRAAVVKTGLAQLGTPYVYGGTIPRQGFDCSGLTYYAHHKAGLSIPRTAFAQQQHAQKVTRQKAQAGDLVFFQTGPKVYHVGIMIDNKRFVHASSSKHQVRIDQLDTPYWQTHFLGAGTYLSTIINNL